MVPDQFIDVKTGETHVVSSKIFEQIEYHAENQTLIHLVLSALNQYLHPNRINQDNEEILLKLDEIKQLLYGYRPDPSHVGLQHKPSQKEVKDVDMKDIEDILDVYGG